MKKNGLITVAVAGIFLLASCASKKNVIAENSIERKTSTETLPAGAPADRTMVTTYDYLKRVTDNQVSAQNVVADMTFTIKVGSKEISVPGSLRMRRDEVIRLQLYVPLLGTEIGRMEFSPNRVLIIDRLHKEYIDEDYTQLDFLKNNDLDFYSLQALFWNQLSVPGKKNVNAEDFQNFDVAGTNVKLKRDNMTYNWATSATGQIVMTNISYATEKSGASSLLWMYSDFRPLGIGQFPCRQDFQFSTSATKQLKSVKIVLDLDDVKDKSDWDAKSTVSTKYKKVEASEILGKLLSI